MTLEQVIAVMDRAAKEIRTFPRDSKLEQRRDELEQAVVDLQQNGITP